MVQERPQPSSATWSTDLRQVLNPGPSSTSPVAATGGAAVSVAGPQDERPSAGLLPPGTMSSSDPAAAFEVTTPAGVLSPLRISPTDSAAGISKAQQEQQQRQQQQQQLQRIDVDAHSDGLLLAGLPYGYTVVEEPRKPNPWLDPVLPWVWEPQTRWQWATALLTWGAMIGGVVVAFVYGFPWLVDHVVNPAIAKMQATMTPAQIGTVVAFAIILLPMVFFPAAPFFWLAALVFSWGIAFLIVTLATTVGMSISFLLTRRFFRKPVIKVLGRYRVTKAILRAVSHAGAWKVTLLLRLGPFGYSILNYVLALPDKITFWQYFTASFIGKLPENAVGILFGRSIPTIASALQGESFSVLQLLYQLLGLIIAMVIVTFGTIYANRMLKRIDREDAIAAQHRLEMDAVKAAQRDKEGSLERWSWPSVHLKGGVGASSEGSDNGRSPRKSLDVWPASPAARNTHSEAHPHSHYRDHPRPERVQELPFEDTVDFAASTPPGVKQEAELAIAVSGGTADR